MSGALFPGTKTSEEPLIKLKLGPQGEEFELLVDTGAEKSTVKSIPRGCKVKKETALVMGAKGEPFKVPVVGDVEIESQPRIVIGDLVLLPEAENNLLGRDLITELIIIQENEKFIHEREKINNK